MAVFGVCSSISYASANAPKQVSFSTEINVSQLQPLPVSATQGNSLTFSFNQPHFERVIDKPLLRIPEFKANEYIPRKVPRRNDIFEFATIFNDKLQQFLSLFDGTFFAEAHAASVSNEQKEMPVKKPTNSKACTSKKQPSNYT